MTQPTHFFSDDDPRLTAFALGELEGEELAAVEAALRDDPAARAAVAEIRALAGQLESALSAEPMIAAATPPTARKPRRTLGKMLHFPQMYYVVGGLAAAAFAVLLAIQPAYQRVRPSSEKSARLFNAKQAQAYAELSLSAANRQEAGKTEADQLEEGSRKYKSLNEIAADKKRDDSTADVLEAKTAPQAPSVREAFAEQRPQRPAPSSTSAASAVGGALAKDRELAKVGTAPSGPGDGNLVANQATSTRLGMEVQRTAQAQQNSGLKNAEYRAYIQSSNSAARTNEQVAGKLQSNKENPSGPVDAAAPAAIADESSVTTTSTADPNQIVRMEKFQVQSEKENGYLSANAATATRIAGSTLGNPLVAANKTKGTAFELDARSEKQIDRAPKSPFNTESYAYQHDNDFLSAAENPLSTFSIDVDTASYANVRRFLSEGQLPPPDAVRIEELVNYFPYRYPAPSMQDDALKAPFAATMEVSDAPWAPGHRLVRIGLKGREVSTAARPAANLVFLLDVSGSMDQPNKLPLVKESMRLLLAKLRPDDRVAIVVYAGASGLALPSTPVAKSADIRAALDSLAPGGSTNGAMGIELAYDIAKANFVTGGLNRVILCTDGDFNVGVTGEGDLTRLIEEKAKSGVFLTVLGFGMGNYKDATLEKLADKGNGNYGYIDSQREAEKLLVEQVSGTLVTIAKDVKLQVEFNPAQVASYRLIGYEDRMLKKEDFNNDAVDAGEIGAGHTVTALYEIVPVGQAMGEGPEAKGAPAVDPLKYGAASDPRVAAAGNISGHRNSKFENQNSGELLTLKVRYKEPTGMVSRKLEFPLTDKNTRFAQASADFRFAAAVAEFGMILRGSPHKGNATLAEVLGWAQAGADDDAGGYRAEFIELVRQAQALMR